MKECLGAFALIMMIVGYVSAVVWEAYTRKRRRCEVVEKFIAAARDSHENAEPKDV